MYHPFFGVFLVSYGINSKKLKTLFPKRGIFAAIFSYWNKQSQHSKHFLYFCGSLKKEICILKK